MNWRKDLLARQAVFDSLVIAVTAYLAGLLSASAVYQSDIYAFIAAIVGMAIVSRKGWRLWHAIHRLARMQ